MSTHDLLSSPGADDLRRQSCAGACGRDTPKLTREEVSKHLASVPQWKVDAEFTKLSRRLVAKNFKEAISFFNHVMEIAEAEGHHPDLHLANYRDIQVVVSTHAIKGLSIYDFILAAKIDAAPVECSPKWLAAQEQELHGGHQHQSPEGTQSADKETLVKAEVATT
ncbi:g11712 [Coccomyxa elongata]